MHNVVEFGPAALQAAKGIPSGPGALSRGLAIISPKPCRSMNQSRPLGTTWVNGMICRAAFPWVHAGTVNTALRFGFSTRS